MMATQLAIKTSNTIKARGKEKTINRKIFFSPRFSNLKQKTKQKQKTANKI